MLLWCNKQNICNSNLSHHCQFTLLKGTKCTKKENTIPRLEFFSVFIRVRSLLFVTKALKLESTERILWMYSKCVLQRIKGEDNQSVFVRNRIKEITEKSCINFWYINTKYNPADLPARGISSNDFKDIQLWWDGLSWLPENYHLWPTWTFPEIDLKKEYKERNGEHKAVVFQITGISQ